MENIASFESPHAASTVPYFFIDGVWLDQSGDHIEHVRGQFMDSWNHARYRPQVFDAEVAIEVFGHRDNVVLLEEVVPGHLKPGPAFRFKAGQDGRETLHVPDRPLQMLPMF